MQTCRRHARYGPAVALDPGDPLATLGVCATAGVFTDFDGTLAPIVRHPAVAKWARDVAELLDGLAQRYGVVAVVSGRPVAFLAALLPASVVLSGLYGLEVQRYGERSWRSTPALSAGAWS